MPCSASPGGSHTRVGTPLGVRASSVDSYGPTVKARRYGEILGVSTNRVRTRPSAMASLFSIGMFAIAARPAGWISSSAKRGLNSGSSKQGYARRAWRAEVQRSRWGSKRSSYRVGRIALESLKLRRSSPTSTEEPTCYGLQMPPQFIFTMRELGKVAPLTQREILRGVTLAFYPDAKIGVLGANGAGKSTLLRIMAGVDREYTGDARITEGFRAGLLAQEPQLDPAKDVRGNVEDGVASGRAVLERYNALSLKLGEDLSPDEMSHVTDDLQRTQDEIEAKGLWELDTTVELAMDALRCPPGDQDVATLSGGERRRVALCRLLLSKPDLLLLDEPTNHLDADSVGWLERHLAEYPGCVVAVTHDRYFLDNVAGWILELDKGAGIPYQGNYSSWLEQKRKRLADEEKQESARQRTLARELEWVRASPRARQAKSKARIEAYERLLAEDPELRERELEISIPPGPRLGEVVVEANGIRKAYGDKLLFEDRKSVV